jgi:hypothetical protein
VKTFRFEPGLKRIAIGRFEFNEHLPFHHIHLRAARFNAGGRKYALGELGRALTR